MPPTRQWDNPRTPSLQESVIEACHSPRIRLLAWLWRAGLALALCGLAWAAPAQGLLLTPDAGVRHAVLPGTAMMVLRGAASSLPDHDVVSGRHDPAFTPLGADETLDCRGESVCWLRLSLSRSPQTPADAWMLRVRTTKPGEVSAYVRPPGGDHATPLHHEQHTLTWRYTSSDVMFALQPDTSPQNYYLRIKGQTHTDGVVVWQDKGFELLRLRLMFYISASMGITIVLMAGNLIFWRWLKDPLYLQFSMVMFGAALLHVWQLAPALGGSITAPDVNLRGAAQSFFHAAALLFMPRLFKVRAYSPWGARAFDAAVLINLAALVVALAGHYPAIEHGMTLFMMAMAAGGIVLLWWIVWKHERNLALTALLVTLPLVSTVISRVQAFGVQVMYTGEGPDLMSIALRVLYMLLMATMIAGRARSAEQGLHHARKLALQTSQRSERELDAKVRQRTADLQSSHTRLAVEVLLRRDAETRLQDSLEVERKAVAQQRQFVAMASHEFRTPLAIIDAAANAVQLSDAASPTVSRMVKIRRAVTRISNLIENFLAEDLLHSAEAHIRKEVFDLRDTLRGLNAMSSQRHDSHWRLCVPPTPVMVYAERSLVEVALQNLVQNALKYSAAESRVTVAVRARGAMACLYVRDQGVGIVETERDKIFLKFYRGTTTHPTSGSGLGLYLVREIAARLGGEVTLLASGPRGTAFRLTVPLRSKAIPRASDAP